MSDQKTYDRRGPRGPKGHRGAQGHRGTPGIEPGEIQNIIRDIEKIQDEAALQFRRIAQIQAQLDVTLRSLKDIGNKAAQQQQQAPVKHRH